jgi:hypothetical protein
MLISQEVPVNYFRAAVRKFSAYATREIALYISLDSTSLGAPLALCRDFKYLVAIIPISIIYIQCHALSLIIIASVCVGILFKF